MHVSEFKYFFGVFWTNQAQMGQNALESWPAGEGLQVPSGPWFMLGNCNLSVIEACMRHCLCLFLRMAVRQCYEKRRRDLE